LAVLSPEAIALSSRPPALLASYLTLVSLLLFFWISGVALTLLTASLICIGGSFYAIPLPPFLGISQPVSTKMGEHLLTVTLVVLLIVTSLFLRM
jgi:hypothetical protein